MKNKKHRQSNKKGQVFIVGIVIAVSVALISAFILLGYYFKDKTTDEHLGTYQSGMIDSVIEGDQAFIYIDETANYASSEALDMFAKNGAVSVLPSNGEEDYGPKCGMYVYNLWTSEQKECIPQTEESFSGYLDDAMNARLIVSGNQNLNKEIRHTLHYSSAYADTTIRAFATDKYNFFVYKNREYQDNIDTQQYAANKGTYAGQFIWPVPGWYRVVSCFGYRGKGSGGSTNHGGIDISAPKGTPVVAVADGTVTGTIEGYNGMIIDHGGMSTTYLHMSKVDVQIGDVITQGQKIGEVGDTGSQQGSFHLHLEVSPKQITSNILIGGVSGIQTSGKRTVINPACIYTPETLAANNIKLDIDQTSKACSAICNKNTCAATTSCATDGTGCFYKFCDEYGALLPRQTICQTTDNTDWKISNFFIKPRYLTGDQKVKISITIDNSGKDCVTITPTLDIQGSITIQGVTKKEVILFSPTTKYTVNTKSSSDPYNNIDIECTFTTDPETAKKSRLGGTCVLTAPTDDSMYTYNFAAKASDIKGNTNTFEKIVTLEVNKPLGTTAPATSTTNAPSNTALPTTTATPALSVQERANLDKTKKNLETLGLIQYIQDTAQSEGVPSPIIFGLITQESGGNPRAGSTAGAYGLTQVIEATFKSIAGNECTWQEFQNDPKCQIRAGIKIIKYEYIRAQGKTIYYSCQVNCRTAGKYVSCGSKSSCGTQCIGPVSKQYQNWNAALRRYNGGGDNNPPASGSQTSGCTGYPDYEYVEKVMRYARAWGYTGTETSQYQQTANDEIKGKGLLGTYSITPSFTTTIPFDMRLINHLKGFVVTTMDKCTTSDALPIDCVKSQMALFNTTVSSVYATQGINVSLEKDGCEENWNEEQIAVYLESVEQCVQGLQENCQCRLAQNTTGDFLVIVKTETDKTTFTYTTNDKVKHTFTTLVPIMDKESNPFDKELSLTEIPLYKGVDTYTSKRVANAPTCQKVDNKVRLCLKTNYTYEKLETINGTAQIIQKPVIIKFAFTLRDPLAPIPVTGVTLANMKHARNKVIVSWNANTEKDVTSYAVYIAEKNADLTPPQKMVDVKKTVPYHLLDIVNSIPITYDTMSMIQDPVCEVQTSEKGSYCIFKYKFIKDGKEENVSLEENQLYYLKNEKRYLAVITDTTLSDTKSNAERFILVTAIDSSGNEIETDQVVLGGNMQQIVVQDLLEPGFVNLKVAFKDTLQSEAQQKVRLIWDPVKIYIDGTDIMDRKIDYQIFEYWDKKSDILYDVRAPYSPIITTDGFETTIPFTSNGPYGIISHDLSIGNAYMVGIPLIVR
ncbi:MAG: peptidoglycan DD-metalloendopeptidase family protein [Candidatus Woesearchaeota archaeon]